MASNDVVQPKSEVNPLTPQERELLSELQRYFADGYEELPAEMVVRVRATLHWDRENPADMERAMYFAVHDPYFMREVKTINKEFARAEGDGLEDY
jgi:hypothetical protein